MPGNFELAEGTIEIWFSPAVELKADETPEHRSLARLMTIDVPEGFLLGATVFTKHGKLTISVHMAHPTDDKALLPIWEDLSEPLRPGQVVHLALTWRGREMTAYLDGRPIGSRTQGSAFDGMLVNRVLRFGDARREPPIILHAVRVSRAAREESALKHAVAEDDSLTLLLDRFDGADHVTADGVSTPQKISSLDGQTTGTLKGHWRFVAVPKPGSVLSPLPTPTTQPETPAP